MGFWGSMFGGKSDTINQDLPKFGQIGGFSQNLGQSNTAKGSQFWSDITSGDKGKIARTLAAPMSNIAAGAQQQRNTTAQFSNRGGGNNASMQMLGDRTRAQQNDMVSGLMAHGADTLLNSGENLLHTALGAYGEQVNVSQMQMENWKNSLFGQALAGGEKIGLGYLGKWAGLKAPTPSFGGPSNG